jgi:hypothetical protein
VAVAGELGLVELTLAELTVGKWRKRFARSGIDRLLESPRPNVHRKLADEKVDPASARR